MKIVDLAEFYSERGGGVRSYLDKLMASAAEHGHDVTVIAPGPRDEQHTISNSARILRYAAPPLPYDPSYHAPVALGRMRKLLRELAPDVLQVSSPFIPAWVAAAAPAGGLKAYVHHSDPIGSYITPFAGRIPRLFRECFVAPAWAYLRAVCRRFDVTVVAGHWLARDLKQRGCQRVQAVPFGINQSDLSPRQRDSEFRRRLLGPLSDDPRARLVLIAGRLAADKRQARLVRALLELSRRRPLALLLLGDGPARPELERLGRRLPAFEAIRFTRDRREYARILASSDVLLHGSVSETFGFVLAEALASGTPLVVPDAAGARALAGPEYSEVFAAEAGPTVIAEALERLLQRPREALSGAARAYAETLPTTSQHFGELFDLYGRLLAQRAHSTV